jgi:hypothetical protein
MRNVAGPLRSGGGDAARAASRLLQQPMRSRTCPELSGWMLSVPGAARPYHLARSFEFTQPARQIFPRPGALFLIASAY